MCQAIKDIKADSRAEGILKTLKAVMSSLLTAEQAVAIDNVPENARKDVYIKTSV